MKVRRIENSHRLLLCSYTKVVRSRNKAKPIRRRAVLDGTEMDKYKIEYRGNWKLQNNPNSSCLYFFCF